MTSVPGDETQPTRASAASGIDATEVDARSAVERTQTAPADPTQISRTLPADRAELGGALFCIDPTLIDAPALPGGTAPLDERGAPRGAAAASGSGSGSDAGARSGPSTSASAARASGSGSEETLAALGLDSARTLGAGDSAGEATQAFGRRTRPGAVGQIDRGDRYARGAVLASGGMGTIRLAVDRVLGRTVALKEIRGRAAEAVIERFVREAKLTAALQHPGIVSVYDLTVDAEGRPSYCMKLVRGRTLEEVAAEATTLEARMGLLPHIVAMADALAYAHSEGVIHRDLKPGNVLVAEFGETIVIDWGLAKRIGPRATSPREAVDVVPENEAGEGASNTGEGNADGSRTEGPTTAQDEVDDPQLTSAGALMGTAAYMAPEQARGEPATCATDVYAIGVILFRLLTGKSPYRGTTMSALLREVIEGDHLDVKAVEPRLPGDLADVIRSCIAHNPRDRYADAGELRVALRAFVEGRLIEGHVYSTWELAKRWFARNRAVVISGALAGTVALVALVAAYVRVTHERDQALASERRAKVASRQATTAMEEAEAHQLAAETNLDAAHEANVRAVDSLTDMARRLHDTGELERSFRAALAAYELSGGEPTPENEVARLYLQWGLDGLASHSVLAGERAFYGDIVVSRDGGTLVVSRKDGILVYEGTSGRIRHTLGLPAESGVMNLMISANGATVVAQLEFAEETMIKSWDARSGLELATFRDAGERLGLVDIDDLGSRIAYSTGSEPRRLRVAELGEDAISPITVDVERGALGRLSGGGDAVVVGLEDGSLLHFKSATGELIARHRPERMSTEARLRGLWRVPETEAYVAHVEDDRTDWVVGWDRLTGEGWHVEGRPGRGSALDEDLWISADGARLSVSTYDAKENVQTFTVIDVTNGQALGAFTSDRTATAYPGEAGTLVTGELDGTITLRDLATGKAIAETHEGFPVAWLAPSGMALIERAGAPWAQAYARFLRWQPRQNGLEIAGLPNAEIEGLEIDATGSRWLVRHAIADDRMRLSTFSLVDASTRGVVASMTGWVAALSPTGEEVAVTTSDDGGGTLIEVYGTRQGELRRRWDLRTDEGPSSGSVGSVVAAVWAASGEHLAVGLWPERDDKRPEVWTFDVRSGERLRTIEEIGGNSGLFLQEHSATIGGRDAFFVVSLGGQSADARLVRIGASDTLLDAELALTSGLLRHEGAYAIDLAEMKFVEVEQPTISAGQADCRARLEIGAASGPLTAGCGSRVIAWERANRTILAELADPSTTFNRDSIVVSPDTQLIAARGEDDRFRIWRTSTRALLATVAGDAIVFAPDGRSVVVLVDKRLRRIELVPLDMTLSDLRRILRLNRPDLLQ